MTKLKTLIAAALTSAALCAPAYAVGPAVDWDPAYFWQAGATPTNLPAGGILKAVGATRGQVLGMCLDHRGDHGLHVDTLVRRDGRDRHARGHPHVAAARFDRKEVELGAG